MTDAQKKFDKLLTSVQTMIGCFVALNCNPPHAMALDKQTRAFLTGMLPKQSGRPAVGSICGIPIVEVIANEKRRQYTGMAIGGPLDGQMIASSASQYRVPQRVPGGYANHVYVFRAYNNLNLFVLEL